MRPFVSFHYNFKFPYIKECESITYNEQWLFVHSKFFGAKNSVTYLFFFLPQVIVLKVVIVNDDGSNIHGTSSSNNNTSIIV